jgi:hypothetical protein
MMFEAPQIDDDEIEEDLGGREESDVSVFYWLPTEGYTQSGKFR